jgi:hypothetical protein
MPVNTNVPECDAQIRIQKSDGFIQDERLLLSSDVNNQMIRFY